MCICALPRAAGKAVLFASTLAFLLALAGPKRSNAQPASAPSASVVPLAGHTVPEVLNGTAPRTGHYNPAQMLRLAIAIRAPHPAEEEEFLKDLYTPGSPNFHNFPSAEEWTARFGPSAEDEQAVVDWAVSQGLTVTNRFSHRLLVDVEAPAGTIEKALHVTINNYQVGEEVDFANDRDPQIPASISGVVSGILGLNSIQRVSRVGKTARVKGPDYAEGPVHSESRSSQGNGDATRSPQARAAARVAAHVDGLSGVVTPGLSLDANNADPANIFSSEAYNYDALYNVSHCCNVHNDAAGSPADTSIALVTFGGFQDGDVQGFFKKFGFAWNYTVYQVDGTNNPGSECSIGANGCPGDDQDDEAPLDVEYSTATANSFGSPNDTAHVYVYEAKNGLYSTYADVYGFIASDNHAHVVSTSYGGTEASWNQQGSLNNYFLPIFHNMIGRGFTLISAAGDNGATDGCGNTLAVDWPASDPDFVAAGGTELSLNDDGSYAGEVAWTGLTGSEACSSNNGGGGGGVSAYMTQPGYQQGLGGTQRLLPDISLNAGGIGQNYYYQGGLVAVGGTSIVAPELAGFFVQGNSYLNSIGHICGVSGNSACEPIGNPNPVLYGEGLFPNAPHYPYYDITSGCNSNNLTLEYGLKAYCAGPGYDKATGWGSANMLQLAWTFNYQLILVRGLPFITWTGPAKNKWYNTNQTVSWVIHDWEPAGSTPGTGIAGLTQGWDSIPSDPKSEKTPGSGNSFYDGPQFPGSTKGCLAFEPNGCSGGVSQGCHTAWARGWNNQGGSTAGNSSFPESYGPICYDTVNPTIAAAVSPASPTSTGWYRGPVNLTITATDPGGKNASGVAHIYYALGGKCAPGDTSACSVYSSAIKITAQESFLLTAFAVDNAGNVSTVFNRIILMDYTPPVTKAGFSGVLSSGKWLNSISVLLKATDNLSGVAGTHYTIDGGAKAAYSAPFKISTVGTHTLKYWSVDGAGNTETANTDTFQIASTTTTSLTSSLNPALNAQNVTLKATVSATDAGTPAGTIIFVTSTKTLGTATLSNGSAALTLNTLPTGTTYIGAQYQGSATYLSSSSATVTEVVHEKTTTAVTVSPSPAAFGASVTLTATVKPSASGSPTGSVSFMYGPTLLGKGTLNSTDVATLKLSTLPVGGDPITAVYSGDSVYLTSTSPAVLETIHPAATTTALTSSLSASSWDQPVTLTATVRSAGGTPAGNVNFSIDGASLGSGLLVNGVARFTSRAIGVGKHSIQASYGKTTDYAASTSAAVALSVAADTTTTVVASSLSPSK